MMTDQTHQRNSIPSPKTTMIDLSPVTQHKTVPGTSKPQAMGHRKSHSLVGFDPLLSPPSSTTAAASSAALAPLTAPNLHKQSVLTQMSSTPLPLTPFTTAEVSNNAASSGNKTANELAAIFTTTTPPLLPPTSSKMKKRQHRKGSQTFCMSDLRSVSEKAMAAEADGGGDIFGLTSSSYHNNNSSTHSSNSNPETKKTSNNNKKIDSAPSTPTKKKELENGSDHNKKDKKAASSRPSFSLTPPRAKMSIPSIFSSKKNKKSHRRAQSLQVGSSTLAAGASDPTTTKHPLRSSVPNSPVPGVEVGRMDTMIQDLLTLDLSHSNTGSDELNDIAIPSLAKPLAHSFLRGKSEENIRTSEFDPSLHQTEIPTNREVVIAARLNEFAENYRRVDQNIDLQQWVGLSRLSLRQIKVPEHQPIANSLLECGDNVSLQGIITKDGKSVDDRVEALIFEGERTFTVVFRGTTEQQLKPSNAIKSKKGKDATVHIDPTHAKVDVYSCFKDEYVKLEGDCFAQLDKLTEQNPFCDVCFTGYSFGATMATLAAVRYANARPMMRVNCTTFASPKVGTFNFKQMVNSTSNLKMMRVELGQDAKCQLPSYSDASHAGHTIYVRSSLAQQHHHQPNNAASTPAKKGVVAYRFEAPKAKMFKTTHPDLRSYVNALEEVARLGLPWPNDFTCASKGVVVNNEKRSVV